MKKIVTLAAIAALTLTLNSTTASAKDFPAGMRNEIVSVEDDDNQLGIFTYKDEDGTVSYYLSLGREYEIGEIFGVSVRPIKEVCLYMGATSEEAMGFLDTLIDAFNGDVNDSFEFPGRLSTGGGEKLGDPTNVISIIKKKFLGGKYLQFHFKNGSHSAKTNISKSHVKDLKRMFKLSKKISK